MIYQRAAHRHDVNWSEDLNRRLDEKCIFRLSTMWQEKSLTLLCITIFATPLPIRAQKYGLAYMYYKSFYETKSIFWSQKTIQAGASLGLSYLGGVRVSICGQDKFCQKVDPLKICTAKSDKHKKKDLTLTCRQRFIFWIGEEYWITFNPNALVARCSYVGRKRRLNERRQKGSQKSWCLVRISIPGPLAPQPRVP